MTDTAKLSQNLKDIAASGKVANAYIFSGGTRAEREELAENFAKLLVSTPADIIKPDHEKPNLFSVDDVRTAINETVYIRPYGNGKKVYIIADGEKMNVQAENALLKTLEEPPEYVVMILLAPKKECFLQTILSRSVKLSISEANELADNEAPILALLRRGKRMGPDDVLAFAREEGKNKETPGAFLDTMLGWFRDVLVFKTARSGSGLIFREEATSVREYADACSYAGIQRIIEAIEGTVKALNANVNFELAVVNLFNEIRSEMEEKND